MQKFEKIRTPEYLRDNKYDPVYIITKGDNLVITEKLDGANAQVCKDDNGNITSYSRNKLLNEKNTLRGFKNIIDDNTEVFKQIPNNISIFGEWLVSHAVKYKQDCYNKWYLFDIFDENTKSFLGYDKALSIYNKLFKNVDFIKMAPLLDRRNDVDADGLVEDAKKYWNNSKYSVSGQAEGFVVTDESKLISIGDGSDINKYLRMKFVAPKFREVDHSGNIASSNPNDEFIRMFTYKWITQPRILKQYYKLRDNGKAPDKLTNKIFRGVGNEEALSVTIAKMTLEDALDEVDINEASIFAKMKDAKFKEELMKRVQTTVNTCLGMNLSGKKKK